jgi:deoxyribose-phosphate aldolase
MKNQEIFSYIDHTCLKPTATWEDIVKLCNEAVKYHTASVCVPPSFVKKIHENYPKLNICTVIGFPLGYQTTETKVFEAEDAIKSGASEIDMVININDAKMGSFDKIREEIKALKNACGEKILKVIIETCYLTYDEKIELCRCVTDAGADYIKTSTGFGTAGANAEDVKLLHDNVGPNVKVKAAGGIKTKEDMEEFIALGADRLGTSSGISILEASNESH